MKLQLSLVKHPDFTLRVTISFSAGLEVLKTLPAYLFILQLGLLPPAWSVTQEISLWGVGRVSSMSKLIHDWINLMHLLNGKLT